MINVKDKGGIFVNIVVIKHGGSNYVNGFMLKHFQVLLF